MLKFRVAENCIIDIDTKTIKDNKIVFPAVIDGVAINSITVSSLTLFTLSCKFEHFDVVIEDGIKNIELCTFNKSNIKSIVIPPSISIIPAACFQDSLLETITFSGNSTLSTIARRAFSDCKHLKKINIPNTINKIDEFAFQNSGLEEITFDSPSNLSSISDDAFENCGYLKSIIFPECNILYFGYAMCRNCPNLISVNMERVLANKLSSYMFFDCHSLKNIILPPNLQEICDSAFAGCSSLKSVGYSLIPIETIGDSAFENCSSFTDGNLPSTITYIGNNAFNCCAIENIVLNSNIKSIGHAAFVKNPLTKGINLTPLKHCSYIGSEVFAYTNITSISIPYFEGTVDGRGFFMFCQKLTSVHFEEDANMYTEMFFQCSALKSVVLPEHLTAIPPSAFSYCFTLESINIPPSVKKIESNAFFGSGLKELNLQYNTHIEIDNKAFCNTKLEEINLPLFDNTHCSPRAFDLDLLNKLKYIYPFMIIDKGI